eukprot:926265-Pleurochrysis_carterae.AAC.1
MISAHSDDRRGGQWPEGARAVQSLGFALGSGLVLGVVLGLAVGLGLVFGSVRISATRVARPPQAPPPLMEPVLNYANGQARLVNGASMRLRVEVKSERGHCTQVPSRSLLGVDSAWLLDLVMAGGTGVRAGNARWSGAQVRQACMQTPRSEISA